MIGRREHLTTYAILVVFSVLALAPLLNVVSLALKEPGSLNTGFSLPTSFHVENFSRAWTYGYFSQYMRTSAIVTVVVVLAILPLSVCAGYAFGTMSFPGRDLAFYTLLTGLVVPFEAAIIPLFHDLRFFYLDDTLYSLILPQVGGSMAFGAFWMRAFFRSIPRSLLESAWMDGAGGFTTLRLVLLPMARPALLTQAVLAFMWSWNEFLLPLVMVTSQDKQTAPLGIAFFIQGRTTDQSGLAAAAVIVALPVVVVYLLLQRSFIRGMFSGAIKE